MNQIAETKPKSEKNESAANITESKSTEEVIEADLEKFRKLEHESFDEASIFDIKENLEQSNLVSSTEALREQEKEERLNQIEEIKSKSKENESETKSSRKTKKGWIPAISSFFRRDSES